jgi:hypothetical protein
MTQGKAQAKRDQVELIAHAEKGRVLPEQLRQGSEPAERQEALRLSVYGSLVETSQLATHAPNFPGRIAEQRAPGDHDECQRLRLALAQRLVANALPKAP